MRVKMSRATHFVGTAGLPQTVCPSLKRRESWTSIAGLSSESIRQSCAMRLRSRRMVVAGRSLSWRDRHHGSGDAQARHQTCGQIPSTDVLLRGGADGIRALSADQEAWPRLHRGGAVADPEETWRSGEDEPTRCGSPSQAIARRARFRAHRKGFQHMGAAGNASVANHVQPVANGIYDLAKLVERGPRPVELASTMIRHHDSVGADVHSTPRVRNAHNPLETAPPAPFFSD